MRGQTAAESEFEVNSGGSATTAVSSLPSERSDVTTHKIVFPGTIGLVVPFTSHVTARP